MLNSQQLQYLSENLSFLKNLSLSEQSQIQEKTVFTIYKKGHTLYNECLGLVLIKEGQFRVYITNEDKQISLYRLLPMDICIFTSSCSIRNIDFDINIEIEKDSEVYILPSAFYEKLNQTNTFVKDFTLQLVSSRFSEVMWVFNQYVFGSAASRLANFLFEQSSLQETENLHITHEEIANDLGTAREVITRLLKHFSNDKIVSLSRNSIKIEDKKALKKLC